MRLMLLALCLASSSACAGFVFDVPQSTGMVRASSANQTDEQVLEPIAWPGTGSNTAGINVQSFPTVSVEGGYNLSSSMLRNELIQIESSGAAAGQYSGNWYFTVDQPTWVRATGQLSTVGNPTENQFLVSLNDPTVGTLFDSRQWDRDSDSTYVLGGLDGNRFAVFEGSLDNLLQPGLTYRLGYSYNVWGDALTGPWSATGNIQLLALPVDEPHGLALAGTALLLLWFARRNLSLPNPAGREMRRAAKAVAGASTC